MRAFRQANWDEPILFEKKSGGRRGYTFPTLEKEIIALGSPLKIVPKNLLRKNLPRIPATSEVEVVRHFTRLSQMTFGIDIGTYPLGSCTMKYNPKVNEVTANSDKVHMLHPNQDTSTIQGALELMFTLSRWLAEITGTYTVSLHPSAGAHGELVGALIIRAYHRLNGELNKRDEIIVPDSAHGTNPASASMAGFKVIVVPTAEDGCIEIEALKKAVNHKTAGLMLTNPNTLGIFEKRIMEMSKIIHDAGGLLYYDGANLNAIIGKARPGDMGFDIVHVNLHKTFSTPHGGGGPGSGPIGVIKKLEEFLPIPTIEYDGKTYYLNYDCPHSIGKIVSFYGNFEILVRAYTYILSMGAKGLRRASEIAVLNTNYLAKKISSIRGFDLPYSETKLRKHECVFSCSLLKSETGIGAKHVAKRLMDYGIHPPTIYFPMIVQEALMIEPTESESLEELDKLIEIFAKISKEAYTNPKRVFDAPYNTALNALDEAKASHPMTMCLSWRMFKKQRPKDH